MDTWAFLLLLALVSMSIQIPVSVPAFYTFGPCIGNESNLSKVQNQELVGLDLNLGLLMPGPGLLWWQFILSCLTQTHSTFWSDGRKISSRYQEKQEPFPSLPSQPVVHHPGNFLGVLVYLGMKVCSSGNKDSPWYCLLCFPQWQT